MLVELPKAIRELFQAEIRRFEVAGAEQSEEEVLVGGPFLLAVGREEEGEGVRYAPGGLRGEEGFGLLAEGEGGLGSCWGLEEGSRHGGDVWRRRCGSGGVLSHRSTSSWLS